MDKIQNNKFRIKMKRSLAYRKGRLHGVFQAYNKVRKAIRNGILPSLSKNVIMCVDCKKARAKHYDHRNYKFPLKVNPVCVSCNKLRGKATITRVFN